MKRASSLHFALLWAGSATFFLSLAGNVAWRSVSAQERADDKGQGHSHLFRALKERDIWKGSREKADAYYKEISKELGFDGGVPPKDLNALLDYFGYGGLEAKDVEGLAPEVLMDFGRLKGQVSNPTAFKKHFPDPIAAGAVLATRFFAPKTTDVSGIQKPVAYSWRKVVRFEPRAGSNASDKGVDALYWMGNFYETDLDKSPFTAHAKYTQVILTAGKGAALQEKIYFLVFDSLSNGGRRTDSARTSWDAADPNLPPNDPDARYYIPNACIHCHGLTGQEGKLNYLDTDHWLDRVDPPAGFDDDFKELARSHWNVLFDADKDLTTARSKSAFGVIRKINEKIAAQNKAVDGATVSIQRQGVEKWLSLHPAGDARHVRPLQRGIRGQVTGIGWDEKDEIDQKLLPMLNRYCYRCHSSLFYHVFDKEAVLARVHGEYGIIRRLTEPDPKRFNKKMPQDRNLTDQKKVELIYLLERLASRNQEHLDKLKGRP